MKPARARHGRVADLSGLLGRGRGRAQSAHLADRVAAFRGDGGQRLQNGLYVALHAFEQLATRASRQRAVAVTVLASQQAKAQWAVRDQRNPQLCAHLYQLLLGGTPRKEGKLDLR